MGNVINNDAFFYNAAFEASKLQSAKAKKAEDASSDKAGKAKNTGTQKSLFSSVLKNKIETDEINSEMEAQGLPTDIPEIRGMSFEEAETFLIDSVYSSGDKLKQSPVQENFAEYKKAVQNFLRFVQSQSYELEETKGIMRKVHQKGRLKPVSKQKTYTLVKVVNEKLDSLASDILYNQKDQLKLAAKIDDLKGLILDITY